MNLPANTDRDLWVSWDDYQLLIERLALGIHESGWQFDKIVCLARGGMRIGDILSRIYDVPLGILATSSYREAAGTQQGQLDIAEYITITSGTLDGHVLLVDDMVDTGLTFNRVREHLLQQFAAIRELRTAVLWYKGHSDIRPDYFVQHLPTNPWIHQPFEDYDSLRPHQLQAWVRKGYSGQPERKAGAADRDGLQGANRSDSLRSCEDLQRSRPPESADARGAVGCSEYPKGSSLAKNASQ